MYSTTAVDHASDGSNTGADACFPALGLAASRARLVDVSFRTGPTVSRAASRDLRNCTGEPKGSAQLPPCEGDQHTALPFYILIQVELVVFATAKGRGLWL